MPTLIMDLHVLANLSLVIPEILKDFPKTLYSVELPTSPRPFMPFQVKKRKIATFFREINYFYI